MIFVQVYRIIYRVSNNYIKIGYNKISELITKQLVHQKGVIIPSLNSIGSFTYFQYYFKVTIYYITLYILNLSESYTGSIQSGTLPFFRELNSILF